VPLLVGPSDHDGLLRRSGLCALIRRVTLNLASWITLYNSEAAFRQTCCRALLNRDSRARSSAVVADLPLPVGWRGSIAAGGQAPVTSNASSRLRGAYWARRGSRRAGF